MVAGLLKENRGAQSMQHLHDVMVRFFDEFREDADFNDDVTFLSMRLRKDLRNR
jgi:hypothetical protein